MQANTDVEASGAPLKDRVQAAALKFGWKQSSHIQDITTAALEYPRVDVEDPLVELLNLLFPGSRDQSTAHSHGGSQVGNSGLDFNKSDIFEGDVSNTFQSEVPIFSDGVESTASRLNQDECHSSPNISPPASRLHRNIENSAHENSLHDDSIDDGVLPIKAPQSERRQRHVVISSSSEDEDEEGNAVTTYSASGLSCESLSGGQKTQTAVLVLSSDAESSNEEQDGNTLPSTVPSSHRRRRITRVIGSSSESSDDETSDSLKPNLNLHISSLLADTPLSDGEEDTSPMPPMRKTRALSQRGLARRVGSRYTRGRDESDVSNSASEAEEAGDDDSLDVSGDEEPADGISLNASVDKRCVCHVYARLVLLNT